MKNRKLSIRISNADWQQVHDKAEQADMTLTEYVTASCLGKRIVVIDVTGEDPILLINPVIMESSGEQRGYEGCLSVPGKNGIVTRPNYVKIKAYNEEMKPFELEGTELLARAICHELDHLDGHMYVEKVQGELSEVSYDEDGEEA